MKSLFKKKCERKKEACPKKSWPLLTYEKHLRQKYMKYYYIQ